MYAGAVAVPFMLGTALKLLKEQVALSINTDLFACGIATFIQAYGAGVGTLIGGLFNTFPCTSSSQNVGLVGVTSVASPMVCVAGGVVILLLGLLPKLASIAAVALNAFFDSDHMQADARAAPLVVADHA